MSIKFSERLKEARNKQGLSQKKLAENLFVSQQTVAKWETDKATPNPETIAKISEMLDVSLNFLLGVEPSNLETYEIDKSSGTIRIPDFGYIPAGVPMEAIEDIIDYEEAKEDWTLGGKSFFALKIKGDSMEPEYRSGDIIIFVAQPDCESNEDCAVSINGNDWTFKRVEKADDGLFIKPLNPLYETKFFTWEQCIELPVEVKGVFWELRRSKRYRKG